jgi:hypothetical protein
MSILYGTKINQLLAKGVMYRMGGRLNAYDAIASYNKQMGGTML